MAPPNNQRDPFTETGAGGVAVVLTHIDARIAGLETHIDARLSGLEKSTSVLQQTVSTLVRIETAQADHSKAMDRAFSQLAAMEAKVRAQEIEMQRHDAVIQAAKFGAGVLGVGGIGALLTWLSKMGGA